MNREEQLKAALAELDAQEQALLRDNARLQAQLDQAQAELRDARREREEREARGS